MTWQLWVVVSMLLLGCVITVGIVGEPRKPITPGAAVLSLFYTGALIALIVTGAR